MLQSTLESVDFPSPNKNPLYRVFPLFAIILQQQISFQRNLWGAFLILHNCRFYACNEDEEKNNGALGISAVVTLKFLQSFLSCPSTPLFPVISKLNYKLNTIIFSSKKRRSQCLRTKTVLIVWLCLKMT